MTWKLEGYCQRLICIVLDLCPFVLKQKCIWYVLINQAKIKLHVLFVWNCLLPHWNTLPDKILQAKNKELRLAIVPDIPWLKDYFENNIYLHIKNSPNTGQNITQVNTALNCYPIIPAKLFPIINNCYAYFQDAVKN